ncbi:MAG: winged helix-turn-helix domain-containing protein [Kiloniellales bacterium]|nr:winged helix-turn-helix domain-containing protein [Kiloniellales bacterium]
MTNLEPRIEVVGTAVADRSRALIVTALMDGRAHTAKELAYRARVSAQTASFHLQHLVDWGLLARHSRGRHRYYFLSGPEVADSIEAMMLAAPAEHLRRLPNRASEPLKLARCCYDHLAGRLGVAVAERLADRGALLSRGGDFSLTPAGLALLGELGLDAQSLDGKDRPLARHCLDWTERRFHLAGRLASVLLRHFLAEAWLARTEVSRALRVTAKGEALFSSKLGLAVADLVREAEDEAQPRRTNRA